MVFGNNRRDRLQDEYNAVKDDLRKLTRDAAVFARDACDVGVGSAVDAKDQIRDTLRSAANKGRTGLGVIRDQVGTRPGAAIAAVFGVGLILGLVLLGRRERVIRAR
jgi:ElaB/YqjD/DUF883 family membrane-anchored ribosome-binding protein